AALFSAAIAFSGVIISGANIWVAHISKEKDLEIATQKELRDFVVNHRDIIYGDDRKAAEQIRNVMRATFTEELLIKALTKIEVDAPRGTRDLFSTNYVQGRIFTGRVGIWGGPNDKSVSNDEGLALISISDLPNFSQYFLPQQPFGTTGLANRLDPRSFYI